ncbi:PEP/pyruvate-binding domain-containing protein [Pseudonocardia sp. 73-21]|uniref:PEP/pyruvate-binding domain-containing protein n=1 Tax=Pseudonocardia sp. 73-21 TaxID=1895809 RepID=UPI00096A1E39|nr:PEP/pyruvate-binding domain-containing protein [Pseudonocardia sp. 73-21]OJY47706.1 MAG: phosphoenolpyruvate synthase [Pseudonocardia sp. 73-21]
MGFIRGFGELGRGDVDVAGGKGANLGELTRAGFPVPPGFVLTTDAYREFVTVNEIPENARDRFAGAAIPAAMEAELLAAHAALGADAVAVRSSATAEDLADASSAGQQDTFLHVVGADAVLVAVRDCWASLWTDRAVAYRARQGIDPASVALAVVVQRMVDADSAGVLFTANPTNGRPDESVVSAAWGLGESVVSGSVTTDDVVVDRAGNVRSRATADKAVMTVTLAAGTEERPVPASRRTAAVLDDAAAVELAALGARIEAHFGAPQDIEWARADGTFWIVQSRPVTALPEPEAEPPTDWTVADPTAMYVRASIVEQLPDPLTPLFADLIDGAVSRSLQKLMSEFISEGAVRPGDVGLPTVNGYAYYRYTRAGLIRISLRSPAALKVLTTSGEHSGLLRWRDRAHPHYAGIVEGWKDRPLDALSDEDLLAGVVDLLDAGAEYYTAVQAIIPLAASSEVAFTQFYERLVRRDGDPPAATFLLGFDSMPILAEKSLYDLATWVRDRPGFDGTIPVGDPEWEQRFRAHLDRFGHTIYNLDFANAVPADDPAPVLDTLRFYLGGGGADPYERQRRSAQRREEETAAVLARLDPLRRNLFNRLLRWAQGVAPVREDALGDIGLAWPQLRRMLRELGSRLVAAGVIEQPDDVFWLRREEILAGKAGDVGQRRMVWRGQRRVTPPQILPDRAAWRLMESFLPATLQDQTGSVLTGTGASAGQVTATARVLTGPEDFGRMQPGDVLVASITTPAWTTLFAMASAVVTDIGGPLSHSSIVAREYGIPAVLGTAVATRRIADGERIHVDGDAGTVTLPESEAVEAEPVAPSQRGRWVAAAAAGLGLAWWVRRRRR